MNAHDERGFSLVELAIALALASLVIGLAYQLVHSHGRYVRFQSDRTVVQQGSRGAVELIASELRGADPLGISEAGPTSVAFRSPRAWGVVCAHDHDGLAVLFPTAAVAMLESGDEWIALPAVGMTEEWSFLPVADRTHLAAERDAAVAACAGLGSSFVPAPGSSSQARLYRPREWNGEGGHLAVLPGEAGLMAGRTVYVYDAIRYDVSTTSTGPGEWLRRSSGPAMQMHPAVGPLVTPGGLTLRYLDESGLELPAPISAGERGRIRSVDLGVRTRSRSLFDGRPVVDSARVIVHLRNVF